MPQVEKRWLAFSPDSKRPTLINISVDPAHRQGIGPTNC